MPDWTEAIPEENREAASREWTSAKTFAGKARVLSTWHPRGHLNVNPVRSLDEYFRYLRDCSLDSSWYRGEPRAFENLTPKLYRGDPDPRERQEKERKYFFEFQRRARSMVPELDVEDTWQWYFLIQHYGGRTRLLDWTHNAAIALFFALGSERDDSDDAYVVCLEPLALLDHALKAVTEESAWGKGGIRYPGEHPTNLWISNITTPADEDWTLPANPIALLPPYTDSRMVAQRSCFTLFGSDPNGYPNGGADITCQCCGRRLFSRIVIDGDRRSAIRRELRKVGITNGNVFPGLDGLCSEIDEEVFPGTLNEVSGNQRPAPEMAHFAEETDRVPSGPPNNDVERTARKR